MAVAVAAAVAVVAVVAEVAVVAAVAAPEEEEEEVAAETEQQAALVAVAEQVDELALTPSIMCRDQAILECCLLLLLRPEHRALLPAAHQYQV